jgi:uncharacterized membrane protein YgcG
MRGLRVFYYSIQKLFQEICMRCAYSEISLHNLTVAKEAKQWLKSDVITREQYDAIHAEYKSGFFHPNLMIRILLFTASLIALGGVTGFLGLIFSSVLEDAIAALCFVYGAMSLVSLEVLIRNSNHYKSGVTEALLYHSMGFIIGGVAGFSDFETATMIVTCLLVFGFCAFRYLDLITTAAALCALGCFLFFELYKIGEVVQQLIPVFFIIVFSPLYFLFKKLKRNITNEPWESCLILSEAFCLMVVYAAGNYFVVRELSVALLELDIMPGEDIPFAFLFYGLTVIVPIVYLYFGIRNKDSVLLRVSLLVIAFSVFTFKYYFSLGHPEFTLTAAGLILVAVTLFLFRYLKTPKRGYTRENILKEKWAEANPEALIISQTMGGNTAVVDDSFKGGGGEFSGGGASGDF